MNDKNTVEEACNVKTSGDDIFRYVFENNPRAISILDRHGYIIEANLKWLEMFGYSRGEINGLHILDMRADEDYNDSLKLLKSVSNGSSCSGRFEGFFLQKNGTRIWVNLSVKVVKYPPAGTDNSIILYVDRGSSDAIDKAHKFSGIMNNVLLQRSPLGIAVLRERKLISVNMAFVKMFGYDSPREMTGITDFNFIAPDYRDIVIKKNTRRERKRYNENDIYEAVCCRKDGSFFNVLINAVTIMLGDSPATLAFVHDITERKLFEDYLKKSNDELESRVCERTREITMLNHLLIKSQEHERQRIARDLHDGVGQSILAAKVNISMFKSSPALYPERLDRGLLLLDQAVKELREISSDLFPSVLDEFGLASAIRMYSKFSLESAGIDVELDLCDEPDIQKERAINLYRIVQESFSNILKHSGADRVNIILKKQGSSLVLSVEDNGTGFDPLKVMRSDDHFGLVSMRQRAEGLGGRMTVDTGSGRGTRIMVILDQLSVF